MPCVDDRRWCRVQYVPTGSVPGAWFQVLSIARLLEPLSRVSDYGRFSLKRTWAMPFAACRDRMTGGYCGLVSRWIWRLTYCSSGENSRFQGDCCFGLNWAFVSGFTYSACSQGICSSGELCLGLLSAAVVIFSVVLYCPRLIILCHLTSDLRPTCIVYFPKIIKSNSQNQSFYFVL